MVNAIQLGEPAPYVIVYGLRKPGDEQTACTIDPEEFQVMVAEFMDGRSAPCNATAEIQVVSMPLEKWESYKGGGG